MGKVVDEGGDPNEEGPAGTGLKPAVENETAQGKERTMWGRRMGGWVLGQGADCGGEWGCSPPPSVTHTHRQLCHCQHDQQGRGICPPRPPSYLSLSLSAPSHNSVHPPPPFSSSSSSHRIPALLIAL